MLRGLVRVMGVIAVLAAPSAEAQEKVASNGPWTAQCRSDRNGRTCEVQAIYDVRKPPLANFWLTYLLKEKQFSVTGAPCPGGGRIRVDKQPPVEFEGCTRCTCQ